MRLRVLVTSLIVLAGCRSDPPSAPSGPFAAQLVLAVGETVDVPGTSIKVRFQGVTGDSRCPADAFCIQGGDAVVRTDVLSSGARLSYELHTGSMQPVQHGDLTLALVQLSPYPFSSRTISPDEYRATLRISR